jgi:hypothetical protein
VDSCAIYYYIPCSCDNELTGFDSVYGMPYTLWRGLMALAIWLRYDSEMKTAKVSVTDGSDMSNITFYEDDDSDIGCTIMELPGLLEGLLKC